jgi:hypothetical protein
LEYEEKLKEADPELMADSKKPSHLASKPTKQWA